MKCAQCRSPLVAGEARCGECGAARPRLPAAFSDAEDAYQAERVRFEAGLLSPEQFKAAVEARRILHSGRYWMLGVQSGNWYVYDTQQWQLADPPIEASTVPPPSRSGHCVAPPPPQDPDPREPSPAGASAQMRAPAASGAGSGVSTFAGTGRRGFADGPREHAQFRNPSGIAAAPDGRLYVADKGNDRVRTISADGTVGTLGRAGSLFGKGSPDGSLASASFWNPIAVGLDAGGDLYVAEENGAIRIVRFRQDKVVSLSQVELGILGGLAVAPDGTFYASETEMGPHHRILKVRLGTAPVRIGARRLNSLADWRDGPADQAWFCMPAGLAVDGYGHLLVADSANHRIRRCDAGGRVTTVAGSTSGYADGPAGGARFDRPLGVAVDSAGRIFVADTGNHRIRRIDRDGSVSTVAGSGKKGYADGPAADARFDTPVALCIAADGRLYVVDQGNHCLRVLDP